MASKLSPASDPRTIDDALNCPQVELTILMPRLNEAQTLVNTSAWIQL
jgi:hypothetical protein